MGLNLDPQAERARDLAKRAVPEGGVLDIDLLLSALYHAGELQKRLPDLAAYLPEPPKRREKTPESVPLSLPLRTVLTDLAQRSQACLLYTSPSPRD